MSTSSGTSEGQLTLMSNSSGTSEGQLTLMSTSSGTLEGQLTLMSTSSAQQHLWQSSGCYSASLFSAGLPFSASWAFRSLSSCIWSVHWEPNSSTRATARTSSPVPTHCQWNILHSRTFWNILEHSACICEHSRTFCMHSDHYHALSFWHRFTSRALRNLQKSGVNQAWWLSDVPTDGSCAAWCPGGRGVQSQVWRQQFGNNHYLNFFCRFPGGIHEDNKVPGLDSKKQYLNLKLKSFWTIWFCIHWNCR